MVAQRLKLESGYKHKQRLCQRDCLNFGSMIWFLGGTLMVRNYMVMLLLGILVKAPLVL